MIFLREQEGKTSIGIGTPLTERPSPPNRNVTASQPAPDQSFSQFSKRNRDNNVTFQNPSESACIKECDVVTDQKGDTGEGDIKESDQVPELLPEDDQDQEVIEL